MDTYRPEFLNALRLLGEAFDDVVKAGHGRPVLVGGAAVEFYSGGALVEGLSVRPALVRCYVG